VDFVHFFRDEAAIALPSRKEVGGKKLGRLGRRQTKEVLMEEGERWRLRPLMRRVQGFVTVVGRLMSRRLNVHEVVGNTEKARNGGTELERGILHAFR